MSLLDKLLRRKPIEPVVEAVERYMDPLDPDKRNMGINAPEEPAKPVGRGVRDRRDRRARAALRAWVATREGPAGERRRTSGQSPHVLKPAPQAAPSDPQPRD